MTYMQLLETGNKTFGYDYRHPFKSIGELLLTARQKMKHDDFAVALVTFSKSLAQYCDENKVIGPVDLY